MSIAIRATAAEIPAASATRTSFASERWRETGTVRSAGQDDVGNTFESDTKKSQKTQGLLSFRDP